MKCRFRVTIANTFKASLGWLVSNLAFQAGCQSKRIYGGLAEAIYVSRRVNG